MIQRQKIVSAYQREYRDLHPTPPPRPSKPNPQLGKVTWRIAGPDDSNTRHPSKNNTDLVTHAFDSATQRRKVVSPVAVVIAAGVVFAHEVAADGERVGAVLVAVFPRLHYTHGNGRHVCFHLIY